MCIKKYEADKKVQKVISDLELSIDEISNSLSVFNKKVRSITGGVKIKVFLLPLDMDSTLISELKFFISKIAFLELNFRIVRDEIKACRKFIFHNSLTDTSFLLEDGIVK